MKYVRWPLALSTAAFFALAAYGCSSEPTARDDDDEEEGTSSGESGSSGREPGSSSSSGGSSSGGSSSGGSSSSSSSSGSSGSGSGNLPFGADCDTNAQCSGGVCVGTEDPEVGMCTRACDRTTPNSCRAEQTLCLPLANGTSACAGPTIVTKADTDDANLTVGDCVTRSLSPLGDLDLYQIEDPDFTGNVRISVTPLAPGVDAALDAYNASGLPVGVINEAGPGQPETVDVSGWIPTRVMFAVVRDASSQTIGEYKICVDVKVD